jgi:transposase-like protein
MVVEFVPTPVTAGASGLPRPGSGRHSPSQAGGRAPKRAKTLNAHELERIRERYLAGGVTTAELGREFGVDRQTVQRKLRAMGVRMYGSSLTAEEIAKAARLYACGLTVAKVAAAIGRGDNAVRNALIRAGVQPRDTHGRTRESS